MLAKIDDSVVSESLRSKSSVGRRSVQKESESDVDYEDLFATRRSKKKRKVFLED